MVLVSVHITRRKKFTEMQNTIKHQMKLAHKTVWNNKELEKNGPKWKKSQMHFVYTVLFIALFILFKWYYYSIKNTLQYCYWSFAARKKPILYANEMHLAHKTVVEYHNGKHKRVCLTWTIKNKILLFVPLSIERNRCMNVKHSVIVSCFAFVNCFKLFFFSRVMTIILYKNT